MPELERLQMSRLVIGYLVQLLSLGFGQVTMLELRSLFQSIKTTKKIWNQI